MGPMTAARRFTLWLSDRRLNHLTRRVTVTLYGSLALTGRGHATDTAVILGLHGEAPESVNPDEVAAILAHTRGSGMLTLGGEREIAFDEMSDILWRGREQLPFHTNGMRFTALDDGGEPIAERLYYSIGGGFVLDEDEAANNSREAPATPEPFPYRTAAELLAMADAAGLTIAELELANEDACRPRAETLAGIEGIAEAMDRCIDRGLDCVGSLPGGLGVPRRARTMAAALGNRPRDAPADPLAALDWINLWALAVNEENAAGGKVVTAPTNGAAGIIPAVLRYHRRFQNNTRESRATFLLTAAAIGALYKLNASISAAEVGCQGEVGVACSMAAAGLAAVMGGTNAQIENAAEIGMEHNLGLTCDPIGGLVQIPCIERNAMGAVKAVDAARLALSGDGSHHVSLDRVIDTMRRTGLDMKEMYKETSTGGLAVHLPNC